MNSDVKFVEIKMKQLLSPEIFDSFKQEMKDFRKKLAQKEAEK